MKTALITLDSPFLDNDKVYVPLASLYLKSYVEANSDHQIIPVNEMKFFPKNYREFDAFGVSVMTPQIEQAKKLVNFINLYYPKKKVILGGPHITNNYDNLPHFKENDNNIIVVGDGEKALVKILDNINHLNIVYSSLSRQDINNAPRPDRTSASSIKYLSEYDYTLDGLKATTMMTSRGCPQKCMFCNEAQTKVRPSSLDNLVEEMKDIKSLGYKAVYLFDDLFALNIKKAEPIAKELLKNDLRFRCNGQADYFTRNGDDFAKMLKDNGCIEIGFGFESGSQRILDNVKKGTQVWQNYMSVEYAKQHDIKVKGFLMIGLPGECPETIDETETFIKYANMDDFQLSVYYPYIKTEIRELMNKGADIDLVFEGEGLGAFGQKGGSTECCVSTSNFSKDQILRLRNYLVKKYKPSSHEELWKK